MLTPATASFGAAAPLSGYGYQQGSTVVGPVGGTVPPAAAATAGVAAALHSPSVAALAAAGGRTVGLNGWGSAGAGAQGRNSSGGGGGGGASSSLGPNGIGRSSSGNGSSPGRGRCFMSAMAELQVGTRCIEKKTNMIGTSFISSIWCVPFPLLHAQSI